MLNKRDFLIGATASATWLACANTALAAEAHLSPAAILSDIALLKRIYTNLHPGLYRYSTPAQIDARFAALSGQFSEPASLGKVYLELSKLLATVRCGHSYANFYSQSEAVQNALFGGTNRLPFKFTWLNNEMVVTDPAGRSEVARGMRISSINRVPTRRILASLLPYVRADGHNIGKQTSLLSVDRDEGFQTFDIFYALHFGASDRFALTGKDQNGRSFARSVPATNLSGRRAMTTSPALADDAPRWSAEFRSRDNIAILTMPTWGLYRSAWDWKAWLETTMKLLVEANMAKLIIDLRGNEGGRDDIGPEILSYLTTRPLPPQAGQRRVRYKKIPDDLNNVLETWDNSFRDWGNKVVVRADGMYDLVDETGRSGGGVTPKATYFSGKVVVLTDATNSSATLQYCQMLRENGLGKIVGGTTGGNLRGINAEKFMFARLPGTGLEVDVPLVGFFPAGNPKDSGLVPDFPVTRTWRDIATGSDPVLTRALAI